MNKVVLPTNTDAYLGFEQWLLEQPYWLQDAAWHIYHGVAIDEAKISEYVDMCVAQGKKEKTNYKRLDKNESRKAPESSKMSVLKLSNIVGVNALATDASLDFSENGVTVIYGLNGAGKSGFMRIFKELSGNPYEEPIQPNVFKKVSDTKPSCVFTIAENGTQREIQCDLSNKAARSLLSTCDVFDTRISNAYITSTNNVSYQPFVFTVLSELSNIADRISTYIKSSITSITNTTVNIPEDFQGREDATWIKQLGADSAIPECYRTWNDEQQARIIELPRLLDSEKVEKELQLLQSQQRFLKPIFDDLDAARRLLQDENLRLVYETYCTDKSKAQTAELLFTDKADEQDRISVNCDDWKTLWDVAQKYYESFLYPNSKIHFGDSGSVCPLCHQKLNGDTLERFQSVNEYINGVCIDNFNKTKNSLNTLLTDIVNRLYSSSQVKPQLSSIFEAVDSKTIEQAFLSLESNKPIADENSAYLSLKAVDLSAALTLLSCKLRSNESRITLLNSSLDDEGKVVIRKEFESLRMHRWVFENISNIETVISNLSRLHDLNRAKHFCTTNKITTESNALASALITDAYIARFTKELRVLAPKIKVKLEKAASKKGASPYKVTLNAENGRNYKPEDILSEGEQRIVALSAFFADATGRNEQTPIIIDDPISSLDYNFEERATNRIVEIAKDRQVIVFTHRISLLVGLTECCKEVGIPCLEKRIRSAVKGKGVPDFEGNYYGKIPNQLNEILGRIAQIKKKDPDSEEYVDAVGRICQQFRICVERTVEDELLFGMVKRFSRRIKTDGLVQKLPAIAKEDCDMIDKMMSKYSCMEHSQPAETPAEYYELTEIEDDIQSFKLWLDSFRQRTKKL